MIVYNYAKNKQEVYFPEEEYEELEEDLDIEKLSHESDIERLDEFHQKLDKIKDYARLYLTDVNFDDITKIIEGEENGK